MGRPRGIGIDVEIGKMVEQAERCAEDILNRSDKLAAGERDELAWCAREKRVGAFVGVALFESELTLVVAKKVPGPTEESLGFE